jgi:hypothetical protein
MAKRVLAVNDEPNIVMSFSRRGPIREATKSLAATNFATLLQLTGGRPVKWLRGSAKGP